MWFQEAVLECPRMSWKHVGFTGKKWDSTSNMVILTKNEGHTGYNGDDLYISTLFCPKNWDSVALFERRRC